MGLNVVKQGEVEGTLVTFRWAGEAEERWMSNRREAREYLMGVARFWRDCETQVRITRQGGDITLTVWDRPSAGSKCATGPLRLIMTTRDGWVGPEWRGAEWVAELAKPEDEKPAWARTRKGVGR